MKNIYFVYEKNGDFKALDHEAATTQETALKADGWNHIATIDAPAFIEYQYKTSPQ